MKKVKESGVRLRQTALVVCLGLALAATSANASSPRRPLTESLQMRSAASANDAHSKRVERGLIQPVARRPAATIEVTNCDDSGSGSLRDAVAGTVDGDTVDLTHLACSSITLTSGYVSIDANISLQGPGASALEISGNNVYGVLQHFGTGTLSIEDLTVANGKYVSDSAPLGGCIYSTGSVVLTGVVVTNCVTENSSSGTKAVKGGGIYAEGNVVLINSAVTGSTAQSLGSAAAIGGGIYAKGSFEAKYSTISDNTVSASMTSYFGIAGGVWSQGGAVIQFSTLSGNRAQQLGAGVLIGQGATTPLLVQESTVSGNMATASEFGGGGLYVAYATTIANSTISGNTEANASNTKYGAGLSVEPGVTVDLESTIVGANFIDNSSAGLVEDDIGSPSTGATLTGSHNLVNYSTVTVPSDTIATDPELAPLADNGGITMTQLPMAGSPAIDAGSDANGDSTDQRGSGYPRVVGFAADIGAVEYAAPADVIFADGFDG